MRHYLHSLDYPGKDEHIACAPDPKIVGTVHRKLDYSNAKNAE